MSIFVDNANILEALLMVARSGALENDEVGNQIVGSAQAAFDYYERFYSDGNYRFPYGSPFYLDGLIVPWNYQSHWGLMLLELYKATGDERCLTRCEELLQAHRAEWVDMDDGLLYWHYWPSEFYVGWSEEDNVSMHTPSRDVSEDPLYEDTSHSAIAARFVSEYVSLVPDGVISPNDLARVSLMPGLFSSAEGFSSYAVSDETPPEYGSFSWFVQPGYDWCVFPNDWMRRYFERMVPNVRAEFDSQGKIFAHMLLYDADLPPDLVKGRHVVYGSNGELVEASDFSLSRANFKDYAKHVSGV